MQADLIFARAAFITFTIQYIVAVWPQSGTVMYFKEKPEIPAS